MAKLTCSEKAWDQARPASVKKTGLGDAIAKALKVLPGDTDKLDTLAECDKARPAITALADTLKTAHAAVAKAKDDKKDAAALLKDWQTDTAKVLDALNARPFTIVEDILLPVQKKWEKPRADLEQKVQGFISQIRDADQNKGHSEKMIQQAVFAMIERAGELKESGAVDSLDPVDYLIDKDFKQAHQLWRDMVQVGLQSTRELELILPQTKQLTRLIVMMHDELVAAEKRAGTGLQLDSPAIRKFRTFSADAKTFVNESATDGAAKYAAFRFIAEPIPGSKEFVAEQEKTLAREFKRLTKVDAERFFDSELAKYGLNEDRLKKTLQAVKAAEQQAQKLDKAAGSIEDLDGEGDPKAIVALKALARTLDETYQRLLKARNNMDVIQALSKDVNKDMKQTIDQSIAYVKRVTETTREAADRFE